MLRMLVCLRCAFINVYAGVVLPLGGVIVLFLLSGIYPTSNVDEMLANVDRARAVEFHGKPSPWEPGYFFSRIIIYVL